MSSMEEKIKMLLFARWISTCYADSHLDKNMKSEHEEGFDKKSKLSVLNRETGHWYLKRLKHFEEVVYPNYLTNGTVKNYRQFIEQQTG